MPNSKAKIEKSTKGISITIPSKKYRFAQIFASVWMIGWIFCLVIFSFFLILSLTSQSKDFALIMSMAFILWIVLGISNFTTLMWSLFGQEKFIIDENLIFFNKTVFQIGIKKRFKKSAIKNFRAETRKTHWLIGHRMSPFGLGPGKILFNNGTRIYSFGLALENEEANSIVKILKEEFKIE